MDIDILNQKVHQGDCKDETQASELRLAADLELVHRVAEGDQHAFAVLYQQFSPSIYTYLVHLVFDNTVAEDLIQEVFLALWTGANRFRGQSLVKTWLFQIAHHKAVSWLRRNVRRQVQDETDQLSLTGTPEDHAEETWLRDQVRAVLAQLSVDHRAVIELAFYHELSYAEIAQIMRCPVGTVKSRMSYARRYLNGALRLRGIRA